MKIVKIKNSRFAVFRNFLDAYGQIQIKTDISLQPNNKTKLL